MFLSAYKHVACFEELHLEEDRRLLAQRELIQQPLNKELVCVRQGD